MLLVSKAHRISALGSEHRPARRAHMLLVRKACCLSALGSKNCPARWSPTLSGVLVVLEPVLLLAPVLHYRLLLQLNTQKRAFGCIGLSPSESTGSNIQQIQPAFGSTVFGSAPLFGASSAPSFCASLTPASGVPTTQHSGSPDFQHVQYVGFQCVTPAFSASRTEASGEKRTPSFCFEVEVSSGQTYDNSFGSTYRPGTSSLSHVGFGEEINTTSSMHAKYKENIEEKKEG